MPGHLGLAASAVNDRLAPWRSEHPGVEVTVRIGQGNPGLALLHESTDARHIVLGTRGRHAAVRAVLGSVSRFVLRHSLVPVTIVPRSLSSRGPPCLLRWQATRTTAPSSGDGRDDRSRHTTGPPHGRQAGSARRQRPRRARLGRALVRRSGRSVAARPADAVAIGSGAGDSVLVPRAEPPRAARPRVVAAVRSLPDDAPVLVDALDAAAHLNGVLAVLHGVPLSFGERSVGRAEAVDRGRDLLRAARALVEGAGTGVPVEIALAPAWPHEILGELLDADLLVGRPASGSGWSQAPPCDTHRAPCCSHHGPRSRCPREKISRRNE